MVKLISKIKKIARCVPFRYKVRYISSIVYCKFVSEEKRVIADYRKAVGKELNLDNPQTLNEKMIWWKLYCYEEYYRECADKYLGRKYIKDKIGEDMCPPLLFVTQDINELSLSKIKEFPCIIKVSNGSGTNLIVNDEKQYTDRYIKNFFKGQIFNALAQNKVAATKHYLEKKPYIVVEKLLMNEKGEIPNDYKLFYINGKLQFVYCSVDRMGINVRHIYDTDWNRLHFIWVKGANKELFDKYDKTDDISRPGTFDEMCRISEIIARDFPIVRVDFYDVSGKLYTGEITLHHGSGSDAFYPDHFDLNYGKRVTLPERNVWRNHK